MSPGVFLNAIPKSGTHMAMRCLSLLPGMGQGIVAEGKHPYLTKKDDLGVWTRTLDKVRDGGFAVGHVSHDPAIEELLTTLGIRTILMVRDPRDVAVSAMHFMLSVPQLEQHAFIAALPDDKTRLQAVIRGFDLEIHGRRYQCHAIEHVYAGFWPWKARGTCCVIRFEDLVGARGGGEDAKQREAIARMADLIGIQLSEQETQSIGATMRRTTEVTFRKGIIGDWRNHFDADISELFKELAAETLIDWGYEQGLEW